jgi:uncharacterized protein (DUF1501 family)
MQRAATNRRGFLRTALALGCSAAAMPLLTHATFAAAPGDARLVVVILRGGMDGLDVIRPEGDRAFAALRPGLAAEPGLPAGGAFTLHPALVGLAPLWAAGEAGAFHATSTPYRDQRSHFDGQDLLEAGTAMDAPLALRREGWLNRMLQAMPGLPAETAFAVGREAMPVLSGSAPFTAWAPDTALRLGAQGQRLLEVIYHDDPLFREAAADAFLLAQAEAEAEAIAAAAEAAGMDDPDAEMAPMAAPALDAPARALAEIDRFAAFAAGKLRAETRIAALSLAGWDTHIAQDGAILRPLARLERLVLRLRADLGPEIWGRTALLAMTEFGRTVRENGSGGTDHGTGGALLFAGGALRGGQVLGEWPGLHDNALYDGRDLMPTRDVRAVAAWTMRGLYGFDRGLLERTVFPGLDMGGNPRIVV